MSAGDQRVGIVGASGFTGAELMRLLVGHRSMRLAVASAHSQAGSAVSDLYPALAAAYPDVRYDEFDAEALDGLDLVFCALPHGSSQDVVAELLGRVGHIVDLGSDFRLKDPGLYDQWYGDTHRHPELLDRARYGLPELFRDDLVGAELIAATGCNAAATIFGLAPLIAAGLVSPTGLVANIATGVSGAGRPPKPTNTFGFLGDNVVPYGLLTHRHTPEIEQALDAFTGTATSVLFTPHLVPMNRGIMATSYGRATTDASTSDVLEVLADAYDDEPFIVVSPDPPQTKSTLGANTVHITARADHRTETVMVIVALDNLVKGASGMAIQNANLALGLDETEGLPLVGVSP